MVKNNLPNGAHSLRGSTSTLSLQQPATINAELEHARQEIEKLQEANEHLYHNTAIEITGISDELEAAQREKEQIIHDHAIEKEKLEKELKAALAEIEHEKSKNRTEAQNTRSLPIHRDDYSARPPPHLPIRSFPPPNLDLNSSPQQLAFGASVYNPVSPVSPTAAYPPKPPFVKPFNVPQSQYPSFIKASDLFNGGGTNDGIGNTMLPAPRVNGQAKSLFEKFQEDLQDRTRSSGKSLLTTALSMEKLEEQEPLDNHLKEPAAYTQPFCDFLTENPTVWHAVAYFSTKLEKAGFRKLSERKTWNDELVAGGKYYTTRNGSSLIAFTVGAKYKSGNGVAMIAGHVDALTARLKPVSNKKTSAGYVQLGVAPYAGALNSTWWDRDLGIGGRVVVRNPETGKITTELVKLGWPIARIPTLAPHFGIGMTGQGNKENQMVPIIGLDNKPQSETENDEFRNLTLGPAGSFAATQPPKLIQAIAGELSISDYSSIVNWELELYDTQPAQVGGLNKEFIFGGRIDDKVCSWAAVEGLLASASSPDEDDGIVKLVAVFDDEEIGSLLRQGARGNFLPATISRITESFAPHANANANVLSQTYANSFLISADVTHAVNPNFLASYLESHAPRLNVGLCIAADSNGHMTTDSVSTALLTRIAEESGNNLQLFMIRNDSRSGGTVGPMLSAATGVRAIDAGIPQLSMHSIRATIGDLDPGLGVNIFKAFLDEFEAIDKEFQ